MDDLTILQLICLSGLLQEFNFKEQVASDVGVGQFYLPSDAYQTQSKLNQIAKWSEEKFCEVE